MARTTSRSRCRAGSSFAPWPRLRSAPVADPAPGYPRNILDEDLQGVLGRPIPRIDGAVKVTGSAPYAYEYAGHGKVAYGFIVGATIANGRIASIDISEAQTLP